MVVCLFPHRKLYVDLKEVIFLKKHRSRFFPLVITDRLYIHQTIIETIDSVIKYLFNEKK